MNQALYAHRNNKRKMKKKELKAIIEKGSQQEGFHTLLLDSRTLRKYIWFVLA
jgi:hypothetical protein